MTKTTEKSTFALYLGVFVFCAVLTMGWSPVAVADTVYTYTGNAFTTFNGADSCVAGVGECHLSGTFTVASPIVGAESVTPLSFSFTDGVHTITQADGSFFAVIAATINSVPGVVMFWNISIVSDLAGGATLSSRGGDTDLRFDATQSPTGSASNSFMDGTWTASVGAPEPGSLLPLVIGLFGVLAAARRNLLSK